MDCINFSSQIKDKEQLNNELQKLAIKVKVMRFNAIAEHMFNQYSKDCLTCRNKKTSVKCECGIFFCSEECRSKSPQHQDKTYCSIVIDEFQSTAYKLLKQGFMEHIERIKGHEVKTPVVILVFCDQKVEQIESMPFRKGISTPASQNDTLSFVSNQFYDLLKSHPTRYVIFIIATPNKNNTQSGYDFGIVPMSVCYFTDP